MRDTLARQILAELARRRPVVAESQRNAAIEVAAVLRSFFYPKQHAFFTSKARRKSTKKTRRAGATTGGVREVLARCLEHAGYRVVVVHSTKMEARDRAWTSDTKSGFVDILRDLGTPVEDPTLEVCVLGGVKIEIRDQVMQLDFSNGSQVKLFGYDDLRAMRKQRGLAKHLYWIDEAQDIRFLDEFYNKVILAQQDFDCEVWLTGTPGQDTAGLFYEITKEEENERAPGWEVHTLAQIDNPFFGKVVTENLNGWMVYYVEDNLTAFNGQRHGPYATFFEAEEAAGQIRWDRTAGAAMVAKGWKGDEPDFIREFKGLWCKEDARFVYPVHVVSPYNLLYASLRPAKNPIANHVDHVDPMTGRPPWWCDFTKAISDLPKRKKFNQKRQWMYAIGADFGYHPDPFAIVVWAFAHDTKDVYELFSWKSQKVHTDDQGLYLKAVWDALDNVVVLVGDPAGKQDDFEVWRTRLQLPIDEANKKGKNTLEEFLADDIRLGRIHLRHDSALYDEMKHLVYLPLKPGKTREAAKHRRAGDGKVHGDHCCFVAGTKVDTEYGPLPIEQIPVGTRVLTREGFKPVERAWLTGTKPTWRVTTADGRQIVGTADHPIWVENAWKPLASLTPGDTLTTCSKLSLSADTAIADTQNTKIDRCASTSGAPRKSWGFHSYDTCTETCGRLCMGLYPQGTTFTTSTKTRSTTTSPTSSCAADPSILVSTPAHPTASRGLDAIYAPLRSAPETGTLQRQVSPGTLSTVAKLWRHVRSWISSASDALRSFSPKTPALSFAATPARLPLAGPAVSTTKIAFAPSAVAAFDVAGMRPQTDAAHTLVLRVEPTGEVEDVYNLTVADCHEYFASGILVSNCDAARYSYEALTHYLSKLPQDAADKGTPEALKAEGEKLEKQIEDREKVIAARMADGDEAYLDSIGEDY